MHRLCEMMREWPRTVLDKRYDGDDVRLAVEYSRLNERERERDTERKRETGQTFLRAREIRAKNRERATVGRSTSVTFSSPRGSNDYSLYG